MAYSANYDEEPDDQHDSVDSKEDGSPSAVLPKAILMGKKFNVGDEVVLKITSIGEDEIGVEYALSKGEGEHKDDESSESMPDDEMGEGEPAMSGGGNYD